ncbi:DNA-(apurinic or apyrimidinic site) lyase 2 isoform X1 [Phalaenopsis equestris]|uniref:DNA-(apurinic or apyrimidinic site) lyase 2 isoform X1 n=1 Tax=Phalaenopsis equestris TaxID=78828 RepID=UPI0009E1FCC1|nr:DNA-(apurinic or apyrimidinic site) lyase 2 isoform X1 [Phalaenopsis equestris]
MKIVTYNVNGLRQRVSQHGSLLKLLNSLDADIICFQETKLQRQELSVDVTMAEGYEAFVSCTRTSIKGRLGYSGVATFCRVSSAFSTKEVALPVAAEEGFTGLLESLKKQETVVRDLFIEKILDEEGFEQMTKEDLLKVDSEGRCIITDHGHFVLFNLYGPRADGDDKERTHFKFLFYKLLQRRWESLLAHGRRVVVVGDLNIAPFAIDRCDAEAEFEKNTLRTWLRSMLKECGGPFVDVFRSKHPCREGAYTCFAPCIGAEEFNYGSRIDHILIAGPCLHENQSSEKHSLFDCHVGGSDIMMQFIRGNFVGRPKWIGGRSIKLEGSDHVPVFMIFNDIPDLPEHSTPALAVRYVPEVRGWQQTIVPFLRKRQLPDANEHSAHVTSENGGEGSVASLDNSLSLKCGKASILANFSFDLDQASPQTSDHKISQEICAESNKPSSSCLNMGKNSLSHKTKVPVKKVKCAAYSQLTLRSYFQQPKLGSDCIVEGKNADESLDRYDNGKISDDLSCGTDLISVKSSLLDVGNYNCGADFPGKGFRSEDQTDECLSSSSQSESRNIALLEWQKIQQKMKKSIPLCKGHSEPCVARSVKKEGANLGRGFYVCARAQGPAANPEANCGHFQWVNKRHRRQN